MFEVALTSMTSGGSRNKAMGGGRLYWRGGIFWSALTAVCGWTFSLIIRALRYMV